MAILSWWAAVPITAAFVQIAAALSLVERAAQASQIKVLRPRSGDVVLAEESKYTFDILWTNNTLDFNASISLRQGPPDELLQVGIINASTINNGTYTWRGRDDSFLKGIISNPSSGCNYSIEVSAGGQRALSEYFTVQNSRDGGLNTTVECPTGAPNITDTNTRTTSDGSQGSGSRGYPAAVLGGAIAAVVAFFVLLFAAIAFFGIKRGWIVIGGNHRRKRGYEAAGTVAGNDLKAEDPMEKSPSVEQSEERTADDEIDEYMRLWRKYGDAQMIGGRQIYQMPENRDGS